MCARSVHEKIDVTHVVYFLCFSDPNRFPKKKKKHLPTPPLLTIKKIVFSFEYSYEEYAGLEVPGRR